jgi:phage tail-like protein
MTSNSDPYRSYNFKLEINGVTEGHFTECSGLSVKIEPITYREAGNNQVVRHIPGPVDYSSITLKFGVTKSKVLFDWIMKAAEGRVERKNVSIRLLDEQDNTEVLGWNLHDAWPSEWKGANLEATDKGVVIEELTLVFDRLERA